MALKNKINFLIDHIDPLGQGVFKKDGDIYFIPKTLPGESGQALALKKKKNIHFCRLLKIESSSPDRIAPLCPHFKQCPGCHFLHTSYEKELEFKKKSFARALAPLGNPRFTVKAAPERTGYRNRIQLHYRKKENKLGFIQGKENKIVEVPRCQIIRPELRSAFDHLQGNWKELAKERPERGHVEIYLKPDGGVKVSWNSPYAASGFSQVNERMNQALLGALDESLKGLCFESALDLFGGDGNLTSGLDLPVPIEHIDFYPGPHKEHFHSFDLEREDSLELFAQKAKKNYELFIVDPPRGGFKLLSKWVKKFSPKYLAYVSCHPQTMIRDLQNIEQPCEILQTSLLDLFPSTFHFEAMTLIEFK
ncbi:MAG: hypothetical protein WD025_08100 [Bacteriovoracaceae bacterium]